MCMNFGNMDIHDARMILVGCYKDLSLSDVHQSNFDFFSFLFPPLLWNHLSQIGPRKKKQWKKYFCNYYFFWFSFLSFLIRFLLVCWFFLLLFLPFDHFCPYPDDQKENKVRRRKKSNAQRTHWENSPD